MRYMGKKMCERKETEVLLSLMRAALRQEFEVPLAWADGCDAEKLDAMIRRQSLVTMVYPVIARQQGAGWDGLRKSLKDCFARETHRGITQEYEIGCLLEDLEKDGIDCLPMKGWVIRDYYPDPLMRSMTDLDVLVKDMDGRKMQQWMETHGYHPNHIEQEVHDTYIKPPYMYIELHCRLMGEDWLKRRHTTWREERLASLWQNTYLLEGKSHLYRFSDEDFLVHHLLHFYKHFTGPGVGLRPLADLYLFLQKNKQTLGQEYLKKQLEELHIAAFSEQMERLTSACFEGQELDERAWLVLDYLTRTGIYGNHVTFAASRLLWAQRKSVAQSMRHIFWSRCFWPLSMMERRYPRLHDAPWLLPVYWVFRVVRIVCREHYKLSAFRREVTQERYDHIKKVYSAAGIEIK